MKKTCLGCRMQDAQTTPVLNHSFLCEVRTIPYIVCIPCSRVNSASQLHRVLNTEVQKKDFKMLHQTDDKSKQKCNRN